MLPTCSSRPDKPIHEKVPRLLFGGALVSLLVVASALQRMSMYTAGFGEAEIRLYTTALMTWISVVLVFFLLTVHRRYFAFRALVSGFLATATLNALDPFIVRTNVAHLEAGKEFDAPYLATLCADAVPQLLDSPPAINQTDRSTIQGKISVHWFLSDADWRTYNTSRYQAGLLVGSGP